MMVGIILSLPLSRTLNAATSNSAVATVRGLPHLLNYLGILATRCTSEPLLIILCLSIIELAVARVPDLTLMCQY